jgi:hypothetical protein
MMGCRGLLADEGQSRQSKQVHQYALHNMRFTQATKTQKPGQHETSPGPADDN